MEKALGAAGKESKNGGFADGMTASARLADLLPPPPPRQNEAAGLPLPQMLQSFTLAAQAGAQEESAEYVGELNDAGPSMRYHLSHLPLSHPCLAVTSARVCEYTGVRAFVSHTRARLTACCHARQLLPPPNRSPMATIATVAAPPSCPLPALLPTRLPTTLLKGNGMATGC